MTKVLSSSDTSVFSHPFISRIVCILAICAGMHCIGTGVSAAEYSSDIPGAITFQLKDFGDATLLHVSLMKEGESYKNGMVRQIQNFEFIRYTHEIRYTPCNDNSCMVFSVPSAGGTTGRDQLILEVTFENPAVDVSSCLGDPTCERLRGGTFTKSGMLDGIFKTGKTYTVSLGSLKAGIGEAFNVTEVV